MAVKARQPQRNTRTVQDLGNIESIRYNDAAGASKVIVVDAPIKRAVLASEDVGPGKYVKITGTQYTLDLLNKAYDSTYEYQRGDVVSESGNIYLAQADNITGVFDATKWLKVAPKQIANIPCAAGAVVTTGRWHNSVTVVGFLVDDESAIKHIRVRD